MTKNKVERKGFISGYSSQVTLHCWGKSGHLEEVEAMEERGSLAYSSWPVHLLTYWPLNYLLRGCSTHAELGPLTSVINQGNVLYICLQAIWWRYFLHWHSSSQINSNYVKLPTSKQTNLPPPPTIRTRSILSPLTFISFLYFHPTHSSPLGTDSTELRVCTFLPYFYSH